MAFTYATIADLDSNEASEVVVPFGASLLSTAHGVQLLRADGYPFDIARLHSNDLMDSFVVAGHVAANEIMYIAFANNEPAIHVVDGFGSSLSPAWPVSLPTAPQYDSLALADMNLDGTLEILATGVSRFVYAEDPSGNPLPGWPVAIGLGDATLVPFENTIQAVGDLDADGFPDVVVGTKRGTYVFRHDGTSPPGMHPIRTATESENTNFPGSATLADLDGDGDIELLQAVGDHVYAFDFPGDVGTIQWARFRNDNGNTGVYSFVDCNRNGMSDARDIELGNESDCNRNGAPDTCDIEGGTSADCNSNGTPDSCEPDCNANGVPDDCDIASGASLDLDDSGLPDECEVCAPGEVAWIDPPNGAVDARYPTDPSTWVPVGVTTFRVRPPDPRGVGCWELCDSLGQREIASVERRGDEHVITLSRPAFGGSVTVLTYRAADGAEPTYRFVSHPGDVNGDGTASASDILSLIDALNGVATERNAPWGSLSTDIDRSGASNAADVLALIDLFNGRGPFSPWINTRPPDCGSCCE